MSNKIYLWGGKTPSEKEYACVLSFTSDELMLNVRFSDLAHYLEEKGTGLSYKDFLCGDDAFSLIVSILHGLQRDGERSFFTADISSKSYLKMTSFFENVVFKGAILPKEKRLEVMDLVYDNLDESVRKSMSSHKAPVFQEICDTTIDVVSSVMPESLIAVRQSIGEAEKTSVIPEIMLSDLFFDMTMLMAWLINHTKHIRKERAYNIVLFSDIEQTMRALLGLLGRNKGFEIGGEILLEDSPDTTVVKAVSTFLAVISDLLLSVIERGGSEVSGDPLLVEKENLLLNEVWKTFQKDASIWMTSPQTNKKFMEYLNK